MHEQPLLQRHRKWVKHVDQLMESGHPDPVLSNRGFGGAEHGVRLERFGRPTGLANGLPTLVRV